MNYNHHPNWWGQPPAILNSWVDRVMPPGIAYEFEEGDGGEEIPIGLLKAKQPSFLTLQIQARKRKKVHFLIH